MKRELIEFMENYSSIAVIKKVLENYLSHRDKLIHDWDKKYVFVTSTDITKIYKYDIDRNNDIPNNKKKVFGLFFKVSEEFDEPTQDGLFSKINNVRPGSYDLLSFGDRHNYG